MAARGRGAAYPAGRGRFAPLAAPVGKREAHADNDRQRAEAYRRRFFLRRRESCSARRLARLPFCLSASGALPASSAKARST